MTGRAPEPCDTPSDDHDGEVRFYRTGWKCDRHSPWAALELPRPAPGPGALDTYPAASANPDHENGQTT